MEEILSYNNHRPGEGEYFSLFHCAKDYLEIKNLHTNKKQVFLSHAQT